MVDKNFIMQEVADEAKTDWYDARSFKIYGLMQDQYLTHRMPMEIASTVNDGVKNYSVYGAGGRIRLTTNSPYIALKVQYGPGAIPTVNNHCVSYGFDLYKNVDDQEIFVAAARPVAGFDRKFGEYKMLTQTEGETASFTLNFPIFASVEKLQIGIEKGSCLTSGKSYRNTSPVVYYGSSITHGAAAGRPGNTYESFISQKYNLDYINLGFSGSAKGEAAMAEYISKLSMSVFVCDYDYNAPSVEHLEKTHFAFYEIIRKRNPDVPYIMVSRPTFFMSPAVNAKRRQIIRDSYEKALELGDQQVFFIDGETLFQGDASQSCTSDGIHPNDLGFFRMAEKIGPVVAEAYALVCK